MKTFPREIGNKSQNESPKAIVHLEAVSKVYGMRDIEVKALNGVSLTVEPGEYCSIMGASGSGKSTAMNIIGCLDRPSSGSYQLDGVGVAQMNEGELAKIRNLKIGFVFQQFHLLSQMTALDNVMLPMLYAGISAKERRERATEALIRVGLENRMHNKPNQLSGGQQQRVAVARALVTNPKLILADEPTGNLDSKNGEEVMTMLRELNNEGTTIVMVTHSEKEGGYADRLVRLLDGQIMVDKSNVIAGQIGAA